MSRIFVLCLLIAACSRPTASIQKDEVERDSILKVLGDGSNKYLFMEDMDSMNFFLNSLYPTVQRVNQSSVTMLWALQKAQQFNIKGKKDSLQYYMKLASDISKSNNIPKRQLMNFYIIYGNILSGLNLIDSAIQIGNAAYQLAIKLDSFRYAETSLDLSKLYGKVDDIPNMGKYVFEAWRCKAKEAELIPYMVEAIATYYDVTEQVDSALLFLEKFDEDSTFMHIAQVQAMGYENTAYFLSKKGNHKEALRNIKMAKDIYDQAQNKTITILFSMSEVYGALHRYDSAFTYLDSARQFAFETRRYTLVKEAWKEKAKLYADQKLFMHAYSALDSAYVTYEMEMDSSLRRHGRELETKYSVLEKDNEIKSLALANLSNLRIRQQQSVIIIAIIIVVTLGAIIGFMFWRRAKAQVQQREADLRHQVLRTHLQPHFLFNMLGLLQGLIRTGDQEKPVFFLTKFSKLLRSILENAGKSFVSLSDELAAMESYLALQAMYFEEKFEYEIDVDESIDQNEVKVPPMLLQPFAENAILHGFSGSSERKNLYINIQKKADLLYCLIDDNGIGMEQSTEKLVERLHATEMTEERLAILRKQTKKVARLKITDKQSQNEGNGVRVEIELPYITYAS